MRYSIFGFNQEKVIEAKLDLTDLLILDYIIRANGNPIMHHILDDSDVAYVWLSHDKIQEDLPILNITEGTLKNRLTDLKQRGFINSKQVTRTTGRGSKAYYSVTEYTIELTTSLENDPVERPRHSGMTSDNKLISDKEKDIITINSNNTEEFIGRVKSAKKKSLYDKCYDHILEFTTNAGLIDALTEYLKMRLQMKDKPLYENSWKGMLNKLSKMDNQIDVVNESIERGWASFFEHKDYKKKGKEVFGEDDKIISEKGEFISSGETF